MGTKSLTVTVVLVIIFIATVRTASTGNGKQARENNQNHVLVNTYKYCSFCKIAAQTLTTQVSNNQTYDEIQENFVPLCTLVLTLVGYHGSVVCPGIISSYGPPLHYVLSKKTIEPFHLCQKMNLCPPEETEISAYESPPRFVKVHQKPQREQPEPNAKSTPLRILHLTDIHLDPLYERGTSTNCGAFMCCRQGYNGTGSAEEYGDFACDLPPVTLDIILDAVNQLSPSPDFILFTGDSGPHDIWSESWDTQLAGDSDVIIKLTERLPNFRIYPSIGNHDTFPANSYYQPKEEFKTFNRKTAEWWQTLFTIPPEQIQHIEYSGYYTALVQPGLRVLSINTDYWYTWNVYMLLNEENPAYYQQMLFIEDVLVTARTNKEKVIIIGHIPPGDTTSATMSYGDFYLDLISRFSDVVVLQTFGHTHRDHFELVRNGTDGTVSGVVFISPSVTPYSGTNPSFRVYLLEGDSFDLLDYEQYHFDLTAANAFSQLSVNKSYTAKSEYGLTDMTPESMYNLTERFDTDDILFQKYKDNMDGRSGKGKCGDSGCKMTKICEAKSASLRSFLQCIKAKTRN